MSKANSRAAKRRAASERGRKWALIRWAGMREGEPSADTMRARALEDARGRVLRHGVTYRGDGTVTSWEIRRSLCGRTDQLDIVADGQVVNSMGRRRLRRILPGTLWEKGVAQP